MVDIIYTVSTQRRYLQYTPGLLLAAVLQDIAWVTSPHLTTPLTHWGLTIRLVSYEVNHLFYLDFTFLN